MTRVRDIIDAMERLAPPSLGMDGDPIGLHAGDTEAEVRRVGFSLDASLAAISAASAWRADMLVVHHPRFFRGIASLAAGEPTADRALAIVHSGMAVYSAHTNFDLAENGTNDQLAALAGIKDTELITVEKTEKLLKLAVFVPVGHVNQVLEAVTGAGAGAIGNYSDCTFRSQGIGTFRGSDATNPFIGKPGVLEQAEEFRLETVFGESIAPRVIAAMTAAHPYEEVAYDVYALVGGGKQYGLGRVGTLAKKETLGALAARMARATGSPMVQTLGPLSAKAGRVAVWAGAGVHAADFARCRADVVIAGEISYHELENFADMGIAVITLGHNFSEEHAMAWLAEQIRHLIPGCTTKLFRNTGPKVANIP